MIGNKSAPRIASRLLPLLLSLPLAAQAQAVADAQQLNALLQGTASVTGCTITATDRERLQPIYAPRTAGDAVHALWTADSDTARGLLQVLNHAAEFGLEPEAYCASQLSRGAVAAAQNSRAAADWDYTLSAMALKFLRELHQGRVEPRRADFDLERPVEAPDYAAMLRELAAGGDLAATLAAAEPRYEHYRLLKAALAHYRELASAGDWTTLPGLSTRSIKPGEAYSGAAALRQRLVLLGDLPPQTGDDRPATLDDELSAGLAQFQQRHGLEADGTLGRRTLAALNVSPAFRVRQIELSLERWRWLPQVETPAIVVNIPQFRLFAFAAGGDREQDMLNMPVVVGQAYEDKRTPVFVGKLKYVVFQPYWDVPRSIAQRELLPDEEREPGYLQRHHFELVEGQSDSSPVVPATAANLARVASGAVRLRQLPGEDNALGSIKFLLPNPYNVYLHGTPARALFGQARRAFSHGCIRVSDPAALAAHVLRNAPDEWNAERIAAAMSGTPNQRIALTKTIPVLILYTTAVTTESGRSYFFDDLYGHDRKLEQLLKLPPVAAP